MVLRPSVSVLLSSASSPSAGSVSRVIHTCSPQRKPERQCCSPAGGKISARTLYNVWQDQTEVIFGGHVSHCGQSATRLRLRFWNSSLREDSRWLSRAGTGSGRVWRQGRRLGWAERSRLRKRTAGRRAGRPSTSPPTSRTRCAYCTAATHTDKHKPDTKMNPRLMQLSQMYVYRRLTSVQTNVDEFENAVCVINFCITAITSADPACSCWHLLRFFRSPVVF